MDWTTAHAGFVTASYAMSFIFIAALMAYVLLRDRRVKRALLEMEKDKP
jgi:heme exporter protein CcmD